MTDHNTSQTDESQSLWTRFLIAASLVLGFTLPLEQMAYHSNVVHPFFFAVRWAGYLLFSIDLLLRFRRGDYVRGGPGRGWLVLDLLSALPIGPLAMLFASREPHWLLSFLHLLPVLRLIRTIVAAREWQQSSPTGTGLRRVISTLTGIGLMIHWIGCWQLAVYERDGTSPFILQYLHSVYWTVTTMTTIGYGDITPDKSDPRELLFTILIMMLGAGAFGFVIGNIATIMSNIDFARNQHMDRMQRINAFMQYNDIPSDLRGRVHRYYSYLWRTRKGFDEASILAELPTSLRREVEIHLRRDIVAKVPFFKGASNILLLAIVEHLKPCIALPNEMIIRKGEIGHCMFFIASGSVEVLAADGKTPVATLTEGNFFGEIALLEKVPRSADVRSISYCDLYTLEKAALDFVIEQYPDFGRHICVMAEQRKSSWS
jgi:voltage-gated potassium channel